MCKLIKVKVEDFNTKSFIRDILNYYRRELNNKDILWWIEGKKDEDILSFNHNGCLEEQFLYYIKKDGNKLYVPFLEYKNVKQAININGEIINICSVYDEDDKEQTVGVEIENVNGSYLIKSLSKEGVENISYIKDRYRVA